MFSFLAAIEGQPLNTEGIRGIGPLGLQGKTDLSGAPGIFQTVLSNIIGVMSAAGIIWFVFQFIVGAIGWISAGGDSKAIEEARKRLTNAVIGLVIILTAMVLISLIGALLGVDILNIACFINKLSGKECAAE
ncbi:MAG: hypothetical protein Q7S60_03615 [bacterium]|nr:hypothetical protein [bacterium]